MGPLTVGRRAVLAAGAFTLCLTACTERHADPLGPGGGAAFTIRWQAAATGGTGDAHARIDSAHVTVTLASTVLLDTVASFSGAGDRQLALPVRLPDPSGTIVVAVELLAGRQVLFRGGGSAQLQRGHAASLVITVAPVVAGVISPDSLTFTALGDTVRLRGAALFATGDTVADAPVAWSGDGSGVIRVGADGLVTALQEGKAQATATSQGFTHVTVVKVQAVAASLALSADTFSLFVDSTRTLSAVVRDRNGNVLPRTISWSSSSSAVATVDAQGVVKAVAPGIDTITAASGGRSARAVVIVRRVPVGVVHVSPDSAPVIVSDTLRLKASVQDITGKIVTDRELAWSTDDPAVATVDSMGLVRGVAVGKVTITATSEGQSGAVLVRVVQPVVAASAAQLSFQLPPGTAASTKSISITNSGTGLLSGLSAAVSYSSADTGWVTAALSAPKAPTTLSITVNAGGLPVGSYAATVIVASDLPGAGTVRVGVTLAVSQPRLALSRTTLTLQTSTAGGSASDTVTVLNAGTGSLRAVAANVTYAANEPTDWLTLSPSSWAVVPSSGSVMALTAGGSTAAAPLGVGTYHATVTLSSGSSGAGTAQVAVELRVLASTGRDVTYPVLHSSVRLWNTAIVSVSAGTISGNTATVAPGAAIRVSGSWQIGPVTDVSYCPGCVIEVYVAWLTPAPANGAAPLNSGLWLGMLPVLDPNPGSAGTFDFTTTAPTAPGDYYIGAGQTWDYIFQPWATGAYGWLTGGPTSSQAVSFRIQVR